MGPLKKIQYNCKKATFLIEKKMIDKLTFREKIELRIHLAGCSVCRLYQQQSEMINEMVQQLFHSSSIQILNLMMISKRTFRNVLRKS